MSFVYENVLQDMKKQMDEGGTKYTNAEFLDFYWLTSREVYNRLLPYPLEPIEDPLVVAFVAHYPEVASLFPYDETGLSLVCKYKGKIGMYWLSMTLSDDIAVYWGREIYGFPKKYGEIVFKKDGDLFEGSGSRRNRPFFSVKADLSKDVNDPELNVLLEKYGFDKGGIANFNFKELLSTSGKSMDYFPRLTACWSDGEIHEQKFGHVEVELPNHPYDPWHEVEIKKLLGCMYEKKTTVLTAAKDLKKIGLFRILKYIPHMFKKYDLRK